MVSIESSCPFCNNTAYNFAYCIGHREYPNSENLKICESFAVVGCCKCKEKFMIKFKISTNIHEKAFSIVNCENESIIVKPIEAITYPEPKEPPTNIYFPDKVNQLIKEVENAQTPAVKAMLCRSILEYVLKEKSIGDEKDNLVSRINKAYEEGLITKVVADWAHILRKIGNKAVHEISIKDKEAKEFFSFIKIFLELVYVIPAKVSDFHSS